MLWFQKYLLHGYMKMDPEPGAGGGSGGAGTPPAGDPPKGETGEKVSLSKSDYDGLMARLEKLEGKGAGYPGTPPEDPDLREKARREREATDKTSSNTRALEAALRFNLGAKDWLQTNASLLPKDIGDIFATAEKETYSDALEKDAAIKSGLIQSFFSVQANMDLLTPGLKSELEDYLKLTKNGKQEKAQKIYDSVFEPAFEMLKRVKKVESLNGGFGNASDADKAYKEKLMNLSKKHYLGEKQ